MLSVRPYQSSVVRRSWRARCPILAVSALIAIVATCSVARPAAAEAFKPFELETLAGEKKTLRDVLGSKATLVFFFFPTCVYCNQAFPEVQKIYDVYKEQGLSMVWINAVPREERLIEGWLAKHGYTVPVLVGASIRAVERDYQVKMTPTHYLLDAQGNVVSTHAGYSPGDEKELERQVQEALAAR
jgi:cytochrome oxidase Cu insertion factor (SCO1/SenC/PrrC family)